MAAIEENDTLSFQPLYDDAIDGANDVDGNGRIVERYIVSAPRSGLNWTRHCMQHFYGQPIPGSEIAAQSDVASSVAFQRSHDALHWTHWRGTGHWQKLPPEKIRGGRYALILRDPLESFPRMAKKKIRLFGLYPGNIRWFSQVDVHARAVFYYEDLVTQPERMLALFEHFQLTAAPGFQTPNLQMMRDDWQAIGKRSRAAYDKEKANGGGAMTKDQPTDFTFHQRNLSEDEKQKVWRFLKRKLTDDEFGLLSRYAPAYQVRPQSPFQVASDFLR